MQKIQKNKNKTQYAEKCHNCSGFEEKLKPYQANTVDQEIAEMDKHELLCCIASSFGNDPAFFNLAEDIFDQLKYRITEYVLKHEYNRENNLSVDLTLWLEEQKSPKAAHPLHSLIHNYLKPAAKRA